MDIRVESRSDRICSWSRSAHRIISTSPARLDISIGVEECDDGNPDNGDDCLDSCLAASCGDGFVFAGVEDCDGGAETTECNVDCTAAACGDAVLNVSAGEQCDDGGQMPGDFCDAACQTESMEFNYTGQVQQWVVPDGVTELRIETWGAEGGGAKCCDNTIQNDGGKGGYAAGTYSVMPGETIYIYVGGKGGTEGPAGFNGGGTGGQWGAGGGGGTDVRIGGQTLADRIIVAGGAAGSNPGAIGALGVGGGANGSTYHVGAGGGGYYGGGGAYAAGGGGGSSYYGNGVDPQTMPGVQVGDGRVVISGP